MMSGFMDDHPETRKKLSAINQAILEGRLDFAESELSSITPLTRLEKRMHGHLRGIAIYHRGKVGEALRLLESTIAEFGSNVRLVSDLLVCQYHAGEMAAFRVSLNRLELLLVEHESALSATTMVAAEMMLGKFFEEEARLAPAVLFYERALVRAKGGEERFRVLLQKARWQALYEPVNELSDSYRELISVDLERVTQELRIELQHSLMLIELRLIGSEHAWRRLERLDSKLAAVDRRLMLFDFIEGSLAQELELPRKVLDLVRSFDQLDPYEEYLRRTVTEPQLDQIDELDLLASKLSWSSYLRLLCLTANRETRTPIKEEIDRKIQLIIRGLDIRSQALWNQRLKQALQTPEIKVDLSRRTRQLRVHGKTVDLAKKKIAMGLLEGLLDNPSLTIDRAIEILWQTSFSPEYYHRLRMSTHRLNTLINEITGLGKVVEVDSQNVRLRPEVTLRCVDEVKGAEMSGLNP